MGDVCKYIFIMYIWILFGGILGWWWLNGGDGGCWGNVCYMFFSDYFFFIEDCDYYKYDDGEYDDFCYSVIYYVYVFVN